MAILHNLVNSNFSIISNDLVTLEISNLAFRVACYLLTRPNNWTVCNVDIMRRLRIKQQPTLAKAWQELLDAKVVSRRARPKQNGRYQGYDYAIGGEPDSWGKATEKSHFTDSGFSNNGETGDLNNTKFSNKRKVESITGAFLQTPHDANPTPESIADHIPAQRPEERLQDTKGKRLNMATVAKNGYPLAAEALQILGTLQAATPSRIALTVTADHLPTVEANLKAAIAFNDLTLSEYMAMSVRRATAKKWLNLSMVSGIGLVTPKGDPMTPDDFASFVAKIMI